jgi:hypothetical protein
MFPSIVTNKPEYNRSDISGRLEFRAGGFASRRSQGANAMKNPLDSLWGTIISGLVLTVILYFIVRSLIAG